MVLQVVTARQYDPTLIIPILPNIHNKPLHKFKKCVIWLKNKISEPTTRLTADIFSPKRFAQQGFGLRELHSSLLKSDCQYFDRPRRETALPIGVNNQVKPIGL